MCSIPPPPPPPQPSTSESNFGTQIVNQNLLLYGLFDRSSCQWASNLPELQEACRKNKVCLENEPYKYSYRYFESQLQVGPTCGLVALSMMLNGEVLADEILQLAKMEGYSSNGEIFSCKYMLKLIQKASSLADLDSVCATIQKNNLMSDFIVNKLLKKAVLLVPYDADFNNSPCLRNGHKAHWAIVCGIIICRKPSGNSNLSVSDNIYLLCKHGKSRHLTAWSLEQLAKSNENLWEFSPERGEDNLIYILPEDGVGGENGLRGQFLLIEGI